MGNELYHYGVKGMKWGVRKDRKSGSAYSTKSKKNVRKTRFTPAEQEANAKKLKKLESSMENSKDGRERKEFENMTRSAHALYKKHRKAIIDKYDEDDGDWAYEALEKTARDFLGKYYDENVSWSNLTGHDSIKLGEIFEFGLEDTFYEDYGEWSDSNNGKELYHYGVKGMKWGVRKKKDTPKGLTKLQKAQLKERSSSAGSIGGAAGHGLGIIIKKQFLLYLILIDTLVSRLNMEIDTLILRTIVILETRVCTICKFVWLMMQRCANRLIVL